MKIEINVREPEEQKPFLFREIDESKLPFFVRSCGSVSIASPRYIVLEKQIQVNRVLLQFRAIAIRSVTNSAACAGWLKFL